MDGSTGRHVAIVGAGIAGLAAALYLNRGDERLTITIVESASRVGGKLHTSQVAGIEVDAGAEAMLARRPEGKELARLAGLGDALVYPGPAEATILSRGKCRPLPKGNVMGVPSDWGALARSGILSPAGLARVPLDEILPATLVTTDVSVASYIRARLGGEVVDRLVEPLLGGVYAGRSDMLSLQATMPHIAALARTERSLLRALRRRSAPAPAKPEPMFTTLRTGLGELAPAVAKASDADVRTETEVRDLVRTERGWRLVTGTDREEILDVDAVIVATPARPASRILAGAVPQAAAELARIDYAGMAIVTLAYPKAAFPRPLTSSGYLVPPVEGRPVKAVTFSSAKWPHLAQADPDVVLVRCSIGRLGEEALLQRDDAELVTLATNEMAEVTGVRGQPIDTRVTRWRASLPQYNVGHVDRVARVRAAVAEQPGLAVCGAAYDGVGIPACIGSARAAATRVLEHLAADHPAR